MYISSFHWKENVHSGYNTAEQGKNSPLSAFPISFLGCTLAISPSETKSAFPAKLLKRFSTCLQKIDQRPIRGEFKVWIYRFYLVQSITFCLAVDLISATVLQKIHSLAMKLLKKKAFTSKKCHAGYPLSPFRAQLSKYSNHQT